jgi:site-specific DNA-methyltransferase (adenine-specific)
MNDLQIDDHKLMLGDCLERMKEIPDGSVDLTVTSPPYDNLRTYEGSLVWNEDIWKQVLEQLYRVTKKGGVVVWVVADATIKGSETGTSFKQALYAMECGFNLHDTMIYLKNSYMPLTHNRYEQCWEYMFVFSKGKPSNWNPIMLPSVTAGTKRNRGGSKQSEDTYAERRREERTVVNNTKQSPNIFTYDVGKNDRTEHNAPFPTQLAQDHIISWSNKENTVLDPFTGSGTTGVACVNTGRKFIGIEKEPKYFQIAVDRIKKALEQPTLLT